MPTPFKVNQTASSMTQANTPAPAESTTPERFIIQNVTQGHHCITDLSITLEPFQVYDLSWDKTGFVQNSNDLRHSLRKGYVQRISPEEWDEIIMAEEAREQEEAYKAESQRNNRTVVEMDGRMVDAESLNLNASDSGRNHQALVSTQGHANDPATYAASFREARSEAKNRGYTLTAADFANQVASNDGRLPTRFAKNNFGRNQSSSTSGDPNRGIATVSTPDGFRKMPMTNFNRDNSIAGSDAYLTAYDTAAFQGGQVAESIDLGSDPGIDLDGDGGGRTSIKRTE